jgi:two-component system chemotaxis response regulator CheY
MVGFCLKGQKLAYTEASDGAEAWSKLQAGQFDLLITDLNMPNMDGKQLIAKVRGDARRGRMPIIMVSTDSEKAQLASIGANAYLIKPFRPQDLIVAIQGAIAGPRGRQAL